MLRPFLHIAPFLLLLLTGCRTQPHHAVYAQDDWSLDRENRPIVIGALKSGNKEGPAAFISYHNPGQAVLWMGEYKSGQRAGKWSVYESETKVLADGRSRWVPVMWIYYTENEHISREEMLDRHHRVRWRYEYDGTREKNLTRYEQLDRRGRLIDAGTELPIDEE